MTLLYDIFILPLETLFSLVFGIFYRLSGRYGFSIILLSLFFTALTTPIYFLAEKWKKKEFAFQARMAAELASVKKHYSGQKRFYLVKNVHRLHGYRPIYALRSSVGILVQIPFFFAAYHFLSTYGAFSGVAFLALRDLGKPDGLLGGVNLLPFVMTAINLSSSLYYTKGATRSELLQLFGLAAFFLVVLYASPSALLLYWTMNNLLSLLKNVTVSLLRPRPEGEEAPSSGLPRMGDLVRSALSRESLWFWSLLFFSCLVAAQTWWLSAHRSTFKYCIVAGFAAGALATALLVANAIFSKARGSFTMRRLAPIATLWMVYAVVLYVLFFDRKQSVYISNPNIKLLSVLLGECIAFLSVSRLLGPHRVDSDVPDQGWAAFASLLALYTAQVFVFSPSIIFSSSPGDIGMSLAGFVLANLPYALGFGALCSLLYRLGGQGLRRLLNIGLLSAILLSLLYSILLRTDVGSLDEFFLQKAYVLDYIPAASYLLDALVLTATVALARYMLPRLKGLLPAICLVTMMVFGLRTYVEISSLPAAAPTVTEAGGSSLPPDSSLVHGFSKTRRNVVFFIADMFNGNYLGRILKESPEYATRLGGFSWYADTLSLSSVTATSLSGLLGGLKYGPEQLNSQDGTGTEKILKAGREFFTAFAAQGYRVAIVNPVYLEDLKLPGVAVDQNSQYVPYWNKEKNKKREVASVRKNALPIMVSLFQSLPTMLKNRLYDDGSWIIYRKSVQFDYIRNKTIRNLAHLDLLSEISKAVAEGPGLMLYIHNELAHEPYGIDAKGEIIDGTFPDDETQSFVDKKGAYYSARKTVAELASWFDWMRREGVYDNTMIVVLSDHGNPYQDNDLPGLPPRYDSPQNRQHSSFAVPLLLVKDFGARGELKVDERLTSNADGVAMIAASAGLAGDFGADPRKLAPGVERSLSFSDITTDWSEFLRNKSASFFTFEVTGSIHEKNAWKVEGQ